MSSQFLKKHIAIVFFILFIVLCANIDSFATHQRAGFITYRHVNGMTYEITLVTYTYTPSPADRPSLEISWGDGTFEDIDRIEKLDLANNISKNTYIGMHTYTAPATYTISVEDKNRNGGVLNIPNSINTAFYVETTLVINPFIGTNSSPSILNPPIENACVNQPFIYNPAAYDIDGDSISYKLTFCKGDDGLFAPGYSYPAASNSFSLDPITGDLYWDSPMYIGEYNVAFLIEEWRFGVKISSITVDMQILVSECNNRPPKIENIENLCVVAGTPISFNVKATDPDPIDIITLTASGGVFQISQPAVFPQPVYGTGSVQSVFSWQTECLHVKKNPYSVVFKAIDNGNPVNLVDLKTVQITIIAPAPDNFAATPQNNGVELTWDKTICENASGYKIYRKNAYYGFIPDSCETGVPAYTGYALLATLNDINTLSYTDDNNGNGLPQGHRYCYMLIAWFSDGAESYATPEVCTELPHTKPIITNVSINNTHTSEGSIYVAWSNPKDLDTSIHPGPYKYLIYRSSGFSLSNPLLIDSLHNLIDTIYIDTLINTQDFSYSYRIDLYNNTPQNTYLIGSSQFASSVFITPQASNQSIKINWQENVPWINEKHIIYRRDNLTFAYDSIDTSYLNFYIDAGLNNGESYCYYVKSVGYYTANNTITPIINFSQIICAVPIDTIPPCPPELFVKTNCDFIQNLLSWHKVNAPCFDDVAQYNIYYSNTGEDDLVLIYTINDPNETTFLHANLPTIAGCYAITAVDSFNNESVMSQIVCLDIDSCNLYTLPNVFTPNNDGVNDFFIPFPYDFVEKIDIQIYNRWGALVFESTNPDINWDGRNMYSQQESSSGVYFFTCDVWEQRLGGIKKRTITGFVHLLRNDNDKIE